MTASDVRRIDCRGGGIEDAAAIAELHERELGNPASPTNVSDLVGAFPSAVAEDDTGLVGFAYSVEFAPDVLQLANIIVAAPLRGRGLGTRMLRAVEAAAAPDFTSMVAVNSTLYPARGDKRDARNLYERSGYRVIYETAHSTIFVKPLRSP